MANEKTPPEARGFSEKAGPRTFKNAPRSNRIIWILIIAGVGSFLFVAYNLLDTSSPRRSVGDSFSAEPTISSAAGTYSAAYDEFVRAFETQNQAAENIAELPTFTRQPTPEVSGSGRQRQQQQQQQYKRADSFLASVPKDVKVVHKEPSKEYTQSRALLAAALTAKSEVNLESSGLKLPGMEGQSTQPLLAAIPGGTSGMSAVTDALSSLSQPDGDSDANASAMAHQDRNDTFIQKSKAQAGTTTAQDADKEYIASSRREPKSKYELMAGSLISGVLMGSINSDTPGSVLGQISENVYDSATGSHLLIPQGSRMIGVYDSHVVYGQNRLVVVWQRILYPDGTSLNLEGMVGGDQAGNAGFKQYVDNHYSRMIGAALLASVFTAAGKIATDNDKDDEGNESAAAEAVMETMSQLGASLAQRNMNVAPTLRIRPGYRFSIVTTKDIAFAEPYRE
jgi:type IV secretory pathway VirB10-like protein